MTLLAADIGNSHTVLGLLHDGAVLDHWRVATDERRTPDEWAVLIRGLLAESSVADPISGIAVCATVPSVLYAWRDMLAPISARLASSCSRKGTRDAATDTICAGETSMY